MSPRSATAIIQEEPEVAILGGAPAFDETLLVGRPNMPDRSDFLRRIAAVFDSGRLTNLGPEVQAFEARVAAVTGARHCIATCNATLGLELLVAALGLTGEVIVPSYTFVATVHALWRQGISPVFCDIDPETHCLDPRSVEAAITSRTTGILGVHMWGNDCDVAALREIAGRRGLRLLFDAAHAFGCASHRAASGRWAIPEVFSFHATKVVHAFEGGAIVTDDDDLARRLRFLVNFGFAGEDRVEHLGTNGKMSEASAAMGLASLEGLDDVIARNRANRAAYARGLAGIPGVRLMPHPEGSGNNCHYLIVEVDRDGAGLSRDELVGALRLENVVARRYFHPGCHRMAPYAGLFPRAGVTLPVTEAVVERVMALPTGLSMDAGRIGRLTGRIAAIVSRASAVRAALAECLDPRLPDYARA